MFRGGCRNESARFFRGLGKGQAENAKTFHISLAHCGICFKTRSAIPGWRSWFVCVVGAGPNRADQTAWQKPGGPKKTRKPQLLPSQGPVARKGRGEPLKFCPPKGIACRRGPSKKRRFGSFAAAGKGTRRRGGGTPFLCSFQGWKEPKIPGGRRNRTGGQPPGPPCRLSPGPRYGGRIPGDCAITPARVVTGLPPLLRRCRWLEVLGKFGKLDGESAPVATSRRSWSESGRPNSTAKARWPRKKGNEVSHKVLC